MLKDNVAQISFVLPMDEKNKFAEICQNAGQSITGVLRGYIKDVIKRNENLLGDFERMRSKISY